ncbi:MAG TPA: hypothetical protein VGY31_09165 [Terriglobia bacterium]|nr:hypothetical protein [Terriglobia bacterium]
MKQKRIAFILVFALACISAKALGNNITTDWSVGSGGIVSFNGSATLLGVGLPVSSILGVGTPINAASSLNITAGTLSFADSSYLGNLIWGQGAPGTLNVTGCVAGLTSASCNGLNNVALLTDTFQNVAVTPLGGTSFQMTFGQIQGSINSSVANYFGISSTLTASSLQLSLNTILGSPHGAFISTNMGGTINADPPPSAAEGWNLVTSLLFLAFVGAIFAILTRARVLRVVETA